MQHLSENIIDTLADALIERMAGVLSQSQAIPRWLSLSQAAKYSGWGQKKLISLAQSGAVYGFQDMTDGNRAWIFDKVSIDTYRLNQGQRDYSEYEREANEIIAGLKI